MGLESDFNDFKGLHNHHLRPPCIDNQVPATMPLKKDVNLSKNAVIDVIKYTVDNHKSPQMHILTQKTYKRSKHKAKKRRILIRYESKRIIHFSTVMVHHILPPLFANSP